MATSAESVKPVESIEDQLPAARHGMWRNVLVYTLKRVAMLALTVVAAVFLIILIANRGGYVDLIRAAQIQQTVAFMVAGGWLNDVPPEERIAVVEETVAQMKDAAGLNQPFLLRSFRWLGDGLTFSWVRESRGFNKITIGDVIVDHLSRTMVVFGTANLFLFGASLLVGLALARGQGGIIDRLFILLTPISAAPAWVFGVLLTVFFVRAFGFSPGGTFDSWPGELRLSYVLVIARHLLLPFLAIFIAGFFQSVYAWRSLFQVYRNEEYVDMAHAMGLPNRRVDRQYIIRPALPALLTSFALVLIILWQEIIALEYFFNIRGLGFVFLEALSRFDTPMIVAIVTLFAYLVAITVFILDLCYALVDPRVRIGDKQQNPAVSISGHRERWRAGLGRLFAPRQKQPPASRRAPFSLPRPTLAGLGTRVRRAGEGMGKLARSLLHYPSAVFGLIIIAGLIAVSIYTVIALPYQETVTRWRGDERNWDRNPRHAQPAWVNFFRSGNLPPTFTFSSAEEGVKQIIERSDAPNEIIIPFTFEYDYVDFPQDIIVDLTAQYEERGPHVTISWVWADGSERELTSFMPSSSQSYYVSRDSRLQRRLRSEHPHQALFLGPERDAEEPISGTYTLRISALLFEPDSNVDADVTFLGQVYGLAGTDFQRRDLMIALLWGTPVALAFGLVAALIVSVSSMLLAGLGAWYGGVVDRIVQFFTEVNLILPFFPVSLMIFTMYSSSIVVVLAVTVALSIFGSNLKTYRAAFLQLRTAPYIEAARAYGAGDWRIVTRYMFPKIRMLLLPRLIIMVPMFVFLEATLAFLGVSDPLLPTWGKLVVAALSFGIHVRVTHVVVAPLALLLLTGFAFAMVGIALERVFEPQLRDT